MKRHGTDRVWGIGKRIDRTKRSKEAIYAPNEILAFPKRSRFFEKTTSFELLPRESFLLMQVIEHETDSIIRMAWSHSTRERINAA